MQALFDGWLDSRENHGLKSAVIAFGAVRLLVVMQWFATSSMSGRGGGTGKERGRQGGDAADVEPECCAP